MNALVVLLIPAAVLALVVRTFLLHPFDTPSGSMSPALIAGDKFFALKSAYGYSRYSFPFGGLSFNGRIFSAQPAYGDIVVFRQPADPSTDYVKRVVGLPGDRIQMKAGRLSINGQPVPREQLSDQPESHLCDADPPRPVKRWREQLPNGVTHETLDCFDNGYYDNTREYVVPAGHYFVMGDNRDNSADSRVPQVGYVPHDYLVGRVAFIYARAGGE